MEETKIKEFLDDVRYLAECDVLSGGNNLNELALFCYLKETWMNGGYGETDNFDTIADEAIDAYTTVVETLSMKYKEE